jgi:nitronate monooxygenase
METPTRTPPVIDARIPLVAAPMAGGPSTVGLARAVASAGAFPFLAGGYRSAHELGCEIRELRRSVHAFGVNLFVPSTDSIDREAFAAYAGDLAAEAAARGIRLDPDPVRDDDGWTEKLSLLVADPVAAVSLTFGLPERADIVSLQAVGTRVWATVTSPAEALRAARAGVDVLVVQGPGAGGHSAVFDAHSTPGTGDTATLVRRVLRVTDLPVVAAGGIDGPAAVQRLLQAGAVAAAVGTLLLRTDEAGTSDTHARALSDPRFDETVITRAFTGRPARALRNRFVDRHGPMELTAYPAVHHLTRHIRRAAAAAGDAESLHLWAGTGWRNAPTGPAAEVLSWLAGEGRGR